MQLFFQSLCVICCVGALFGDDEEPKPWNLTTIPFNNRETFFFGNSSNKTTKLAYLKAFNATEEANSYFSHHSVLKLACPSPMKNFSRFLIEGKWIPAAYSRTVALKWGFIWHGAFPRTNFDVESCLMYEYRLTQHDEIRFDVEYDPNEGLIYDGFDIRTGPSEISQSSWAWETFWDPKVIAVCAAEKINENDTVYGWMLTLECDPDLGPSGWTLLINIDLYETNFYNEHKEMFAEKLKQIPGFDFSERLEPKSPSCKYVPTQLSYNITGRRISTILRLFQGPRINFIRYENLDDLPKFLNRLDGRKTDDFVDLFFLRKYTSTFMKQYPNFTISF